MIQNRLAGPTSLLGPELRRERRAKGLRQIDLAAETGLSEPTVVQCERGTGRLDSFMALANTLGFEVSGRGLPPGEHIGVQLMALRERRGVSIRTVAELAQVSPGSVTSLESGKPGVRLAIVEYVARVLGVALRLRAMGETEGYWDTAAVTSTHGGWSTPKELLEQLYPVVGGRFDLDPCAPTRDKRKAPVKARLYYTAEDDGLLLPWCGSVFVNPPYGRGIERWVAKAKEEALSGNASPVIALIPARPDTAYFHDHIARIADVFWLRGRLRFGDGTENAPFPSALVVWGATDEHRDLLATALSDAWFVPAR